VEELGEDWLMILLRCGKTYQFQMIEEGEVMEIKNHSMINPVNQGRLFGGEANDGKTSEQGDNKI
jgi:hypothetical protein